LKVVISVAITAKAVVTVALKMNATVEKLLKRRKKKISVIKAHSNCGLL